MNLRDEIKKQVSQSSGCKQELNEDSSKLYHGTFNMVIEQTLNKLFYIQPDHREEIEMLFYQKVLTVEDKGTNQRKRTGLHLSAILASEKEFCYREQILSLFYEQLQGEQIQLPLKRIFHEGSSIGEKWQRLFVSGKLGVKEDMDISRFISKYDLSYTPDAIINIGKHKWLVEIKSMNTFQFKKANSHPMGRKQLRMYMYFEKIKHGFVLVEDKNCQEWKPFIEIYNETFYKDDIMPYIERLEAIQEYKKDFLDNRKMVNRASFCNSSNCERAIKCNMREACWQVGKGRVKL